MQSNGTTKYQPHVTSSSRSSTNFFFLPFIIIIIIIIYWYQRANDLAMNRHLKKALFKNRKKTFIT